MRQLRVSETVLYFNSRDEMIKVRLDRVAYIEADSNYCHVVFINGTKATILTSLLNMEKLIIEQFGADAPSFIRIGKRYIVNKNMIFQINLPRQKLVLSDYTTAGSLEIAVSKEALKNLKQLYSAK